VQSDLFKLFLSEVKQKTRLDGWLISRNVLWRCNSEKYNNS
jgi:hypothetical protein